MTNWRAKLKSLAIQSQAESMSKMVEALCEGRYKYGIALLNDIQNFTHTYRLSLYYKWCVKNGFSFALQFLLLTLDSL
jgi:hypothetical protein